MAALAGGRLTLGAALVLALGCARWARPTPHAGGRSAAMRDAQRLYAGAEADLAGAEADYRKALLRALASGNPYERHLALRRLTALGQPPDGEDLSSLVDRLPETTPLPSEGCALDPTRCDEPPASSGALAARLLEGYKTSAAIVAAVVAQPAAADLMRASLRPGQVSDQEILRALPRAGSPATSAALLRFALGAGGCAIQNPDELTPLLTLAQSADAELRRLAPLVVLRMTQCHGTPKTLEPARAAAAQAVAARLDDDRDRTIAADVAAVGQAAYPVLAALVARLERTRGVEPRRELLRALGKISKSAHTATPTLLRLLDDPADRPLRPDLLATLGNVAWGTPDVKTALLAAAADANTFSAAVEALADTHAPLAVDELAAIEALQRKRCPGDSGPACAGTRRALDALARIAEDDLNQR